MLSGPLAAAGSYSRRLMVDAAVWSKTVGTDAGGGQTVTWVDQQRTVKVQLTAPSPQERQAAEQEGIDVDLMAMLEVDTDVVRGDRLVVDGRTVELVADPQRPTNAAVSRTPVREEPWDEPV